jgi:outer membrane immunogenic protein
MAVLISTVALAADLPVKIRAPAPPSAYSWGGCHAGADVGYAWQRDKDDEFVTATGALAQFSPTEPSHPHGIKGGGFLGCDWQFAPEWAVGLEGDAEGADVAHSRGLYAPTPEFYESRTRFESSFRGRVGRAFDRTLVYLTGGLAFAQINDHYVGITLPGTGLTSGVTDDRLGWTLGAGVDYAFINNWTARVEYRHADFGAVTNGPILFCTTCETANERHRTTEDAIRLGVAYKFMATR